MGWISRLFGIRRKEAPQQRTSIADTFALDLPSDPAATRVPIPRKKGRTTEEQKSDRDHYHQELRAKSMAAFERDRTNALYVGSTKYIWHTCNDEAICAACARKDGKRFAWNSVPIGGHPGESDRCTSGSCRCYAEPTI